MILVLESDPQRIEFFQQVFGEDNVDVTSDVGEALQKLASSEYKGVFLEYNIGNPKENGLDMVIAMEREQMCPDTPIIIHTDDSYGIRHMTRILKRYHEKVSSVQFDDLVRKYSQSE